MNFKMFPEPDIWTWYHAEKPNYTTNTDLRFPYSATKCFIPNNRGGGYELVKIPLSLNNLISHVDYWGEGRVDDEKGISGFTDSYNINHQFKLVSSGPDKNKRIPNRIPVCSYTDPDSDTSNYIKENSVLNVTVVGERITYNCIKDIARIVNRLHGKVVVYGVDASDDSPMFRKLTDELIKKSFVISGDYILPPQLIEGLTFKSHVTFLSTEFTNPFETSREVWKNTDGPNYSTNINLLYLYSGVHVEAHSLYYHITVHPEDKIHHVDYWGEGRIVSAEGISGFPNSYNVNHEYKLVSSGPDRDKKIPNRIPITNGDTNCALFILHGSVLTVTVEGARITRNNSWCIKDIARIVNNNQGKVVVYGVQNDSQVIEELKNELMKKELFLSEDYTLPSELQGLTRFDSHVAFLNKKDLGKLTYSHVVNGNYDSAVKMSTNVGEAISEIVEELISSAPRNVMIYAYKLWHDPDDHDGANKDVVRNHFKPPFQYLMDGKPVTIVNKHYGMALKIHLDTEQAQVSKRDIMGDGSGLHKTDSKLSWRCHPTCYKDNLTFTLCNVDSDFFMRMDFTLDKTGDRSCWGAKMFPGGDETGVGAGNFLYHLEPLIGADGDLVFIIMNVRYKQGLKLFIATNANGDRLLCGHDGNIHNVEHNRFRWVVAPWSSK